MVFKPQARKNYKVWVWRILIFKTNFEWLTSLLGFYGDDFDYSENGICYDLEF